MAKHVEMINEYLVEDDSYDFEFFDNHGLLIRCKDCKHYSQGSLNFNGRCKWHGGFEPDEDWYCADGEKNEE